MDKQFYVISVMHTLRKHLYMTIWRPDNKGYCWALSNAGKYDRKQVMGELGYYNSGCSNVAVPCAVLDRIAVVSKPGHLDNNTGPVVPNNRAVWQLVLKNLIAPVPYQPKPEYNGARRQKGCDVFYEA